MVNEAHLRIEFLLQQAIDYSAACILKFFTFAIRQGKYFF